jgi:hypothetical protein
MHKAVGAILHNKHTLSFSLSHTHKHTHTHKGVRDTNSKRERYCTTNILSLCLSLSHSQTHTQRRERYKQQEGAILQNKHFLSHTHTTPVHTYTTGHTDCKRRRHATTTPKSNTEKPQTYYILSLSLSLTLALSLSLSLSLSRSLSLFLRLREEATRHNNPSIKHREAALPKLVFF